jgi:hypothetical protein
VNRGTWKSWERWWSLQLGGRRVPVSGRQRGDQPDVEHDTYSIEVKCGRVMSPRLTDGMKQAVASAAGTNKTPLLCVTHRTTGKRDSSHYVVMRLADFQAWNVPVVQGFEEEPE